MDKSLSECEEDVKSQNFLVAARAFQLIRDNRLYLSSEYRTFDLYCKGRWNVTRHSINQLIRTLDVVDNLAANCSQKYPMLPNSEGQCRSLSSLDPDVQRQAWGRAIDLANGFQPRAITVKQAVSEIKQRFAVAELEEVLEQDPDSLSVMHHGLFQDIEIEPGSIDVVITDPPYGEEWFRTYSEFSERCSVWLKPGGSAFVMIGQSRLPEAISVLTTHLSYHWMIGYFLPMHAPNPLQPAMKVFSKWKPVLWLRNGPKINISRNNADCYQCKLDEGNKTLFEWQQGHEFFEWLVSRFVWPTDVVLDPFAGVGTTGLACQKHKRRFIGIEENLGRYQSACRQLKIPERKSAAVEVTGLDEHQPSMYHVQADEGFIGSEHD